jgi:hypothetical protein
VPIDPTIPLQVRTPQFAPPESPVNMLAKVLQIQGHQQENALNGLKMDEYRRGADEQNALMRALQAPGFSWDNEDHRRSAFAASPTRAQQSYKGYIDTQKDVTEIEKRRFDMAEKGYSLMRDAAAAHFHDPNLTRDGVVRDLQLIGDGGFIKSDSLQRMIAMLPEDPEQLRGKLRQMVISQIDPKHKLEIFAPKPEKVDNGGAISFRDVNPLSPTYGQPTAGAEVAKVPTPGERLSAVTQRRGQDLTNERQREFNGITQQGNVIKGGTELRKEFEDRQEVKNFRQAMPVLASAKNAPDTPQGDLQLIYAVGKVLDPASVVREGEMNMVVRSGTPEQVMQGYLNYLGGGGRIPPAARRNLIRALEARTNEYQRDFSQVRSSYEELAKKRGIAGEDVFMNDRSATSAPPPAGRTVQRTGTLNGRRVVQYSDGSTAYAE